LNLAVKRSRQRKKNLPSKFHQLRRHARKSWVNPQDMKKADSVFAHREILKMQLSFERNGTRQFCYSP
jgi:hypothetical protein